MLRLTDWSNSDQMKVLYVFGNLTELLPCQIVFDRPFMIKEHVISMLSILDMLKSWHTNGDTGSVAV